MTRSALVPVVLAGLLSWTAKAQPAADDRTEEVIEAAFRQQIAFWLTEDARKSNTVVCLAVEQAGVSLSVTREYLQRFREPAVRRGAECEARPAGAVERSTGRPAVLLTAREIAWHAADEAWITLHRYRSRLSSGSQSFRVVREQTRWICLGPITRLSPA